MDITTADAVLFLGVVVTLGMGIYNLRHNKRTAFINAVTTERVKWIGKVRENVSTLCALCDQWMTHPNHQPHPEIHRQMEQVKNEIRLQLNPSDPEDQDIERLLSRLPSWTHSMTPEEYRKLQATFIAATQVMLKREWDKVKEEAIRGDLRKAKCCWRKNV